MSCGAGPAVQLAKALLVGPALLHEDVHLWRAARGALHALPLLDEAHHLGAFHFLGQDQVGNALTLLELATSLEEAGQSRAWGDAVDPHTKPPRTAAVSNPRTCSTQRGGLRPAHPADPTARSGRAVAEQLRVQLRKRAEDQREEPLRFKPEGIWFVFCFFSLQ